MPSKPPHAVALMISWTLSYGVMALVAASDAGLAAWLQGTIYLLAATLFGLGFAEICRFIYQGERAGYRRGVYFIVAGWIFAGHAYYRIREHRADVLREESQMTRLVDAVRAFRESTGRLPDALDELPELPPHPPKIRYERLGQDFHVSFRHDVFVYHDFDSAKDAWRDEFHPP